MGIKESYYFRAVPESWDEDIIKEIAELGHEIGYHYDDLAQCGGVHEKAILRFQKNPAQPEMPSGVILYFHYHRLPFCFLSNLSSGGSLTLSYHLIPRS